MVSRMKFTTSENNRWIKGVGEVPKEWIDYGLDHQESMERYFQDHIVVHYADSAGYEIVDFLFEDGKAFRLEYEWSLNVFEEKDVWGDEPWILDYKWIEDIDPSKANILSKTPRDWLPI
jgi:hypothetical protein